LAGPSIPDCQLPAMRESCNKPPVGRKPDLGDIPDEASKRLHTSAIFQLPHGYFTSDGRPVVAADGQFLSVRGEGKPGRVITSCDIEDQGTGCSIPQIRTTATGGSKHCPIGAEGDSVDVTV